MTSVNISAFPAEEIRDSRFYLPAGDYIISDPCYTLGKNDEIWQELIEHTAGRHVAGVINGHPVLGLNTAFGDGTYPDQDGMEYWVDSGLIGAVPVALLQELGITPDTIPGRVVTVPSDFTLVAYTEGQDDGVLVFQYDLDEDSVIKISTL